MEVLPLSFAIPGSRVFKLRTSSSARGDNDGSSGTTLSTGFWLRIREIAKWFHGEQLLFITNLWPLTGGTSRLTEVYILDSRVPQVAR